MKVRQKLLQNTIYIRKIWVDTNLSIRGSPTRHNPVVFLINSLYLTGPTRSSRAPDWTSDPTDDFGIISLTLSVRNRLAIISSSYDKGSFSSNSDNDAKAHIQGLRDHQDVVDDEIKAKCDLWLQDPPGSVNGVRAL